MRLRCDLELLGAISEWRGSFAVADFSERSIQSALEHPLSEFNEALACAQTALKADFDYSFLVNAAGLLTRCYHASGGELANPVFSKYTVQALYALRRDVIEDLGTSEGELIYRFQKDWKGTGKYAGVRAQLGSCSSQSEFLEAMVRYGLADYSRGPSFRRPARRQMALTALGEAFLAKLHPDCEDPDLPFRLDAWQANPSLENRQASQRYLRTWFGKQKKLMERTVR
jgi:hypothetical protein